MRISVMASALLKTLAPLKASCDTRTKPPIPVLACVRFDVRDDFIAMLDTTDMEMSTTAPLHCEIDTDIEKHAPGMACINYVALVKTLRAQPKGALMSITADHDDSPARIENMATGAINFIPCCPVADMPAVELGALPHMFTIPTRDLTSLLTNGAATMSTEASRCYLNGAFLTLATPYGGGDTVLRMVSTDGHRLAQYDVAMPQGATLPAHSYDTQKGILIPRPAIIALAALLKDATSFHDVWIEISDTRLWIDIGETQFGTKLIDGTFPDYERVIPRQNEKVLQIDRDMLHAAIKSVTAGIGRDMGAPAIKMTMDPRAVVVSTLDTASGNISTMRIDSGHITFNEKSFEVGMNAHYMLGILKLMSGSIEMRMSDRGAPIVFHDEADAQSLFVLMPVRV